MRDDAWPRNLCHGIRSNWNMESVSTTAFQSEYSVGSSALSLSLPRHGRGGHVYTI